MTADGVANIGINEAAFKVADCLWISATGTALGIEGINLLAN